jgi:hypothetical protein
MGYLSLQIKSGVFSALSIIVLPIAAGTQKEFFDLKPARSERLKKCSKNSGPLIPSDSEESKSGLLEGLQFASIPSYTGKRRNT